MPAQVTMPKLTDTMEEGTIVRWLKQVGDRVEVGDILAEIETDKADMELEASEAGVMQEIKVNEGDTAPVGAVIAVIGAERAAKARTREQPSPVQPVSNSVEEPTSPPEPQKAKPEAPVAKVEPPPGSKTGEAVLNRSRSPEAARQAERPAAGRETDTALRTRASKAAVPHGRVELSKMRLTIAKRMAEAKREVPHFYVTSEIDMGEAVRLRESLEATGMLLGGPVSVTHLIIKAAALALQRHPRVNAAWDDGAIVYPEAINLGIATAVEDGLLVPVLRGCEGLSLADIASAARELNEKAKGGRFTSDEMLGATFSISNLGMLDVDEFSAVINPPQAAILAVGAIKERAVARAGQLAIARTMRVTLSCDHRVLNGVEGARFLEELKRLLENPVALVMG